MNSQTLVTCYIVHVIRDSKIVWTVPESFSRESAHAYAASFNASEKARTHTERMVVVRQQVRAEWPVASEAQIVPEATRPEVDS